MTRSKKIQNKIQNKRFNEYIKIIRDFAKEDYAKFLSQDEDGKRFQNEIKKTSLKLEKTEEGSLNEKRIAVELICKTNDSVDFFFHKVYFKN